MGKWKTELENLSRMVGAALQAQDYHLATAESCTGGWIAKVITDVEGSSGWFDAGFVTYSNAAKRQQLGVSKDSLKEFGAVSEAVVKEMTAGALTNSEADVALAVSGVAGPTGGQPGKPVGTVWFCWRKKSGLCQTAQLQFDGDREQVRKQTVRHALEVLLELLAKK